MRKFPEQQPAALLEEVCSEDSHGSGKSQAGSVLRGCDVELWSRGRSAGMCLN